MEAIIWVDGTPTMLPLTDNIGILAQRAERLDTSSSTGGPDVEPMAGVAASATGRSEVLPPECGRMESILLPVVMTWDKLIPGICRGIQFINAVLCGMLQQDLPSQHPGDVEHHMNPPYDVLGRSASLVPDAPLASLLVGQTEIAVSNCHHQAAREPATGLGVMAVAPGGVIEALYRSVSHFLWAAQWHPEFFYKVDPRSQTIFNAFVGSYR